MIFSMYGVHVESRASVGVHVFKHTARARARETRSRARASCVVRVRRGMTRDDGGGGSSVRAWTMMRRATVMRTRMMGER